MGAGQIIAVDVNEERLKIAEAMGAHYLLNPEKEKVKERIKLTQDWGKGPGVVIEASGNVSALREALDYLG